MLLSSTVFRCGKDFQDPQVLVADFCTLKIDSNDGPARKFVVTLNLATQQFDFFNGFGFVRFRLGDSDSGH